MTAETWLLATPAFEYNQYRWGDLICGTKDELQALGLAVGLAFPGESRGPKMTLRVLDPRGFPTKIKRAWDRVGYVASIKLPGRCSDWRQWRDYSPGVTYQRGWWFDGYRGTAEALAAAGLLRLDQLPGQPGMRKVVVTVLADGSLLGGKPTANNRRAREPGARWIQRVSKSIYEVTVIAPTEEHERRKAEADEDQREWERCMDALPRPAPLAPLLAAKKAAMPPTWRVIRNTAQVRESSTSPPSLSLVPR